MPRHQRRNLTGKTESVFLNIPYDSPFENLYLAYIAGVSAFGLKPRAALEIPSSNRRLDRVLNLIQECEYSIHDLSRVELDRTPPSTPRFNMPFELGLTVALEKIAIPGHGWVVCESRRFRLKKSLTDLDGTDPYIHDGTILGLFRELGNAFVRNQNQPSVEEMTKVYRILRALQERIATGWSQSSVQCARVSRFIGFGQCRGRPGDFEIGVASEHPTVMQIKRRPPSWPTGG